MTAINSNYANYRFGRPREEILSIFAGKAEISETTTGNTPPGTPPITSKKVSSESSTTEIAKKTIAEVNKPSLSDPKPLSKHHAAPIDLAYKAEAGAVKSSIENIAQKISNAVSGVFRGVANFFSRVGRSIKNVFTTKPVSTEERVQKHLADIAVHLAEVKGYSKSSNLAKRAIKPILQRIILDNTVLPKAFNTAKALLQNKIFGPGKARPLIEKLEKTAINKLGDDLAAIYEYDKGGLNLVQTEGRIIEGLAGKRKEDMSDEELNTFAQRHKTIYSYIKHKIGLKKLELKLQDPNLSNQENQRFEEDIQLTKRLMDYATTRKLREDLQQKLDNSKTPIFEKQQLRMDIATLNDLIDLSKYPKTVIGVLHKALYPLSTGQLKTLSARYDIIRKYYPKVKILEDHETRLQKTRSRKENLEEQIQVQRKRGNSPSDLKKLREELKKKEAEIEILLEVILKTRGEVNTDNYATQAVLEHVRKITPVGQNHALQLDWEIKALTEIIEIEAKVFKKEQKYIRDISHKIFDLVYPDGLPIKFTLPLRILNQNPTEIILNLLDLMLFNAIDTASSPSTIFSLVNDLLIGLDKPDSPGAAPQAQVSGGVVVPPPGLEKMMTEILRIGFPKITLMLKGGSQIHQASEGIANYLPTVAKKIGDYIPAAVAKGIGGYMPTTKGINTAFQGIRNYLPSQDIGNYLPFYSDVSNCLTAVVTIGTGIGYAKKWAVDKEYLKVAQNKINDQKEAIIQKLETSGDDLINQGLELVDGIIFPEGNLRAFRPGFNTKEMNQLKGELKQNIDSLIKQNIDPLIGENEHFKSLAKDAVDAGNVYINRLNMQVVNKHLVYGFLDQVIAILEV